MANYVQDVQDIYTMEWNNPPNKKKQLTDKRKNLDES